MQTQPRFTVTTILLVALVGLAFLSRLLAPYISVTPNPTLAKEQATFLQSGARENVKWRPVSDFPFQEARRLDRPILLVVGTPWSRTARRVDGSVFTSPQVQKLLARDFFCIRVDAVENPDWMSAYLPLSRAQLGVPGDFQIWMLDSQAQLFTPIVAQPPDLGSADGPFMDELIAALRKLQDARAADTTGLLLATGANPMQTADLARLAEPSHSLLPDLAKLRNDLLVQTGASPYGGFPVGGRQRMFPDAWLFLLASADPGSIEASLRGLLQSPTRDLLDGGFFFGARDAAWMQPSYDKVAALNAEMCLLLSQLSALRATGAPYRRFAAETFDSLAGEFLNSDGLIRPCRFGDERSGGLRSLHSSFTPRQIRSLLDGVERDWSQANLHLRTVPNPSMTPFLTDFRLLDDPMFDRVVKKLRNSPPAPGFGSEVTLGITGFATARLIQSARVLGDPDRLRRAREIADRIDLYRRGSDVVHELSPSDRARPTLPDYLAFADASLQNFLVSSRIANLRDGASVLSRALDRFAIPGQGGYRMALPESPHRVVPDSNTPQICDDTGESANAAVVRLTWAYSRLLSRSSNLADRKLAETFASKSTAAVAQFADLAAGMGPFVGGYARAASHTVDDTLVLCSGIDPATLANDFAPSSPLRMVAPAVGPVFPELMGKPGYYILRRGQLTGPLSKAAALKLLPPRLDIGG
ncbi:MAG TPA: DUF255 domain-containing protein [Fimbriimonadaceae bacterium]|nr:DUF255 domain-containing protein [Fimbriimonadaceae bacterium]